MKDSSQLFHIEKLFSLSPDLLCVANIAGYFEKVNPAFTQILGYSKDELLTQPFFNLIHKEDLARTQEELDKLIEGEVTIHFENRYRTKQGKYHWFSWKAYFDNETGLLYAVARDITDKKILEKKLLTLSQLDPLTGVLNRRAFTEICTKEICSAANAQFPISLIIFDLDYFKEYNDNKGHIKGDRALKVISRTVRKQLAPNNGIISRYGGDEFLVLLRHSTLEHAMHIAEQMRSSVNDLKIYYQHKATKENITITLGVTTILPTKNYSVNKLIAVADNALYKAKKAGKNQVIGLDFNELIN